MYNPMLDTFIAVCDYGSFTKAADHLYISPTAVMKQMNALESHLNLKLIERSPAGVHVTPAGDVIYRDAKFMIDYSKKSIAAANAATHTYDTTFCVGTSLLNPQNRLWICGIASIKVFLTTSYILFLLKITTRAFCRKSRNWEKNLIS